MTLRTKRIFFYLTLALVCYAVAATAGRQAAFFVFVSAGAISELLFWKALVWPARR